MLNVHLEEKRESEKFRRNGVNFDLSCNITIICFFFFCRKGHVKSSFFAEDRGTCARKRYSEGKRLNVTLGLINAVRVLQLNCRDKTPNAGIQSQTGKRNVHTCMRTYVRTLHLFTFTR